MREVWSNYIASPVSLCSLQPFDINAGGALVSKSAPSAKPPPSAPAPPPPAQVPQR